MKDFNVLILQRDLLVAKSEPFNSDTVYCMLSFNRTDQMSADIELGLGPLS